MFMMVKKRHCKLIALFLLIVYLVPFIPVTPVAADPLPVQVPDFPYNQDSYYNVNNGGFALWQVHGSNYISYVQTFSSGAVGNLDPIVIFNKTLFYDNYTYYLDVNYITDTWDIYGNHIDGWAGSNTSNIRVPRPLNNPEIPDSDVYATLVYCSDDVRWRNGSDTGIYMFMNYLVPGYADPTPTPTPEPEIDKRFPTFINAYYDNRDRDFRYINFYLVVNRFYDEPNTRYTYDFYVITERQFLNIQNKWEIKFLPKFDSYDFINNTFTARFLNVAPDGNWDGTFGGSFFHSSNYKTESDIYDLKGYVSANAGSKLKEPSERNYELSVPYDSTLNYEATAIYIINTDGSTTRIDGNGGETPSGTPTPTPRPTVIPQPSTTPSPTEPPDDGDDGNWTGLFGWLKKLVNALLSIPMKIVNGLLSGLKYIFIPDMGKIKALFHLLNDKFGINVPGTFEFDPVLLKNPENVVMHFKPVSLNGDSTETVDITIIDFDKVDDWLESAPGQVITRIIQAVYMLTMWAYMIYIFRKHVATINYTDSETLNHSYYLS